MREVKEVREEARGLRTVGAAARAAARAAASEQPSRESAEKEARREWHRAEKLGAEAYWLQRDAEAPAIDEVDESIGWWGRWVAALEEILQTEWWRGWGFGEGGWG